MVKYKAVPIYSVNMVMQKATLTVPQKLHSICANCA